MSIDITGIVKKFITLLEDSIKQFSWLIQTVAALLILFVYLNCWAILPLPWKELPLWGAYLSSLVNSLVPIAILYILINALYLIELELCNSNSDSHIVEQIEKLMKDSFLYTSNFLAVMEMLRECINLLFSFYYLLFAINLLLEFCNGDNDLISCNILHTAGALYTIAFAFVCVLYFATARVKHYKNIMERTDTGFYDSNHSKIYLNDFVLYKGKEFMVMLPPHGVKDYDNKKYMLSRPGEDEWFYLDVAAQDIVTVVISSTTNLRPS